MILGCVVFAVLLFNSIRCLSEEFWHHCYLGGVCFFGFFTEDHLVLEFRLFVFLLFHDLLLTFY